MSFTPDICLRSRLVFAFFEDVFIDVFSETEIDIYEALALTPLKHLIPYMFQAVICILKRRDKNI